MFKNLFECIERHLHNACFFESVGEKVENVDCSFC